MSLAPLSLLVASDLPPDERGLAAWLRAAGAGDMSWCTCSEVVQRAAARAPSQVVLVAPAWDAATSLALAAWGGEPPCPVTLATAALDEAAAADAAARGVRHWLCWPGTPEASVAGALAWAHAADARARRLREQCAQALAQLEDRKWIDRAKGVLMTARGLSEDEAFRLLRGAAMNVNLRLGEISRAVTEAAQWADAVNRAGQLRMLSQRLVRLAAQRLLGIDPREGGELQQSSARRVQENLESLAALCEGTAAAPALDEARAAWNALRQRLARGPAAEALPDVDARAEALREAAERLTAALEAQAGRRSLRIVNLCGRQRMHAQRVAKCALLAALAPTGSATALGELQAALDAFEAAHRELDAAPLSSAQIRESLDAVRDEWARLLGGLRASDPRPGQRAVVHASEVLLGRLDGLTQAYERSLQVIMG